ncbi:ABC transporter substrate-binding protein [Bosea sp. Root483D1]|uniref:ABC transporter substrate-binding protein n=1 Tax=Bosea sp. Root483D1 TaxID=1736544 RepID=UPI00138F2D23|nr:ABC transporter substrate-binding protein [Bosea sp. Root483D1]
MLTLLAASPSWAQAIRVTDIAGREVVLAQPAKRIVLGAWVSLDVLSLIHPDPVGLLAGWAEAGANAIQPAILRSKFPAIDKVPVIGKGSFETISIEAVIAQKPDLVLLSRFDAFRFGAEAAPGLDQLAAAGIPVAIVDFFLDPLTNTEPSLRLLGKLLGREVQAEAFLAFYRQRLAAIDVKLKQVSSAARPAVFLHAFATRPECCFSAGPGTIDGFIRLAGGHNIGTEKLATPVGQLSQEFVLTRNPDVYVATAISDGPDAGSFALGPGVEPKRAAEGFIRLLRRNDLAALGAVSRGRAFGLWHLFVHTPVHLVAIEALAKWTHPELFVELDPQATLDEINNRFLAAPLEGTFWISSSAGSEKR